MEEIKQNNEDLDFSWYIQVILKRFWLIAGFVIIGIVCAVLVNIFMRPMYKATALLMIEKEQAGKIDVSPIGSFSAEEDYYRTQYKLLESRSLLEKVYKGLNLYDYDDFKDPRGFMKFQKALQVEPVTRSRLVNLNVFSHSPELAAKIANTLAQTFVSDNISNRISMAQDVINALESTQKSAKEQELLNSMPQVVNSDFIKNLKVQEADLMTQKAKLSSKYTANHPEIISLNNQIKEIQKTIATETNRLIQSIKIELSGQFSGNNIRIIDGAQTPEIPVRPRKLLNLAIGILAGGLLGLLLVFVLEFWDQSVRSSEDLDSKLGLPFLGFIPVDKVKKGKKEYDLMLKEGNILMAEKVRDVRTMLDFAAADNINAPFLISSALQGEGKSHLSTNLSVSIAQTGKKVLLIDGDLRRNRLHRAFHLSNEAGLSNIWSADAKKADYKANIQEVPDVKNLFIMTAGQRPPNPAELLNTPQLEAFIKWAQQNFDQVIVDCPAIMPVSDTLLWGKYIPRVIFVVKYGKTNAKLAASAIYKLKKAGVKILGGVISNYRPEGLSYSKYSYYKHYNYKQD